MVFHNCNDILLIFYVWAVDVTAIFFRKIAVVSLIAWMGVYHEIGDSVSKTRSHRPPNNVMELFERAYTIVRYQFDNTLFVCKGTGYPFDLWHNFFLQDYPCFRQIRKRILFPCLSAASND